MCHIVLLCVESGNVGVKLIDLGNCFSPTGTDTSRISFEMQTLPFRAPEVQSTVFLTMAMSLLHNSIQCHAVQCSTQSLLHEPNGLHTSHCWHWRTAYHASLEHCSLLQTLQYLVHPHHSRTTPDRLNVTTSASTSTGQRLPACMRLSLCLIASQCMDMCACRQTSCAYYLV